MKNIFLTFILFTFSAVLFAQRNDTTLDITMQVVSWQEIVEYDRLHAPDSARINARIATRHKGKVHPERSTMLSEGLQSSDPHGVMEAKMRAASPLPTATFAGLGDNNNYIPSDVQGAAGPNHLMIALNTEFRIQNRAGMVLSTVSIFSFFSGFPTALPFDTRIVYDPYSKRWIIITASDDNMSTSSLIVAASHSAGPTGNWNIYRIFVDPQNQTTWIDYPQIGLNKRWLTIAGAMYTIASPPAVPQFSSAKFYIFDKASLYGGNSAPPFQLINTSSMGENMAPVFTHDTTTSSVFLLQNHNGNINGNGILNLYKISGQLGSAVLTQVAQINTPNPWADIPPQTDFAPQLNTTSKISLNDSRILDAVYRNHTIWGVHHIFLPVSNIARCAVQFWQIDTTGQVIQRGRIDDQSGGIFYGFPSMDVNCNDDVLIGFSTFSSTQYASAAYAFREGCDTLLWNAGGMWCFSIRSRLSSNCCR
ncbi:MAG: hypothetical protein RQ866_00705 [Bacteroidales bacterium]|nr:hypothetical protein [Bacteroidales bacterium]